MKLPNKENLYKYCKKGNRFSVNIYQLKQDVIEFLMERISKKSYLPSFYYIDFNGIFENTYTLLTAKSKRYIIDMVGNDFKRKGYKVLCIEDTKGLLVLLKEGEDFDKLEELLIAKKTTWHEYYQIMNSKQELDSKWVVYNKPLTRKQIND